MSTVRLEAIHYFPVKGLGPIEVSSAALSVGQGLPHDRRFALALSATQFDPDHPEHIPKTGFAMLMKNERLAKLQIAYTQEDATLTISRGGKQIAKGSLIDHMGKTRLEDFFNAFLKDDVAGHVRIVEGRDGHMFSDHKNRVLSIINLDTVKDLERVVKAPVDPVRFRGNLIISGSKAWEELQWEGREFNLGEARLRVTARIDRCGATNVDPKTGERDMNIPKTLMGAWGHIDCGVYAEVLTPGSIEPGALFNFD